MPTNKEWLYSLDPHELTEWFESEYDSNDTLGAKKVVSSDSVDANDANVSTHVETANDTSDGARAALDVKIDSRAKLEADVREFFDACYARVVLRFIDRQAAITQAECERICDTCEWPSLAAQPDQEAYDMIDALRSDLHAARSDAEYYRGKLGDVLDCVCEALRVGTLDASVMFPDGAVNANFHREERRRWKAKNAELQEQVDELTEQRDRWRENWNRRNVEYSDLVNEFEELRDEKTKLESTLDVILDALADYWLPDER